MASSDNNLNDRYLVYSMLGIIASVGLLALAIVLACGLECTAITWGPATVCISGNGPGPSLPDKVRNGYTEYQLRFFSHTLKKFEDDPGLGTNLYLAKIAGIYLPAFMLIFTVITHRRAFRRQQQS